MRRFLLPLSGMALVAVAAIATMTLLQPPAPATPAEQAAEQAAELAAGLRCPDCEALSVAESRTAAADAIRAEIDALLAAGRSADEVRDHFVSRYGQWILLEPADPLAWWLPVAVLFGSVAAFVAWLLLARRIPPRADAGIPASERDRRRAREEAEGLDA